MDERLSSLRLDHVGVQVRELAPAIKTFCDVFGYHQATDPVVNTHHQVEVVFLEKPGSMPLKLFRTLDDKPQPPKLHHLAFQVDDLEASVGSLVAQGARLLSPPTPGEAFDGEPIAFLFLSGFNVELFATDKRRARRQP